MYMYVQLASEARGLSFGLLAVIPVYYNVMFLLASKASGETAHLCRLF